MDLKMLRQHLDQSKRHAEESERHIALQRKIVAELEAAGRDATESKRLLVNFEKTQQLHLDHIERLEDRLKTMRLR